MARSRNWPVGETMGMLDTMGRLPLLSAVEWEMEVKREVMRVRGSWGEFQICLGWGCVQCGVRRETYGNSAYMARGFGIGCVEVEVMSEDWSKNESPT